MSKGRFKEANSLSCKKEEDVMMKWFCDEILHDTRKFNMTQKYPDYSE